MSPAPLKGSAWASKFLANIRETDAIVHVVRCFESEDIIHVAGQIDPIQDIEVINLELCLSDLQSVENIIPRIEKQAKAKKELVPSLALFQRIRDHLNQNKPLRTLELSEEDKELLKPYPFLTSKKVIYACNVSEKDLPEMDNEYVRKVRAYAQAEGNSAIPICARLEEEIAQLSPEERTEFLESVGLHESGLQRLIRASFYMLGLITYLTTGEIETRAWTITRGLQPSTPQEKSIRIFKKGLSAPRWSLMKIWWRSRGAALPAKPVKCALKGGTISSMTAMSSYLCITKGAI